jgi:hypothetical protein
MLIDDPGAYLWASIQPEHYGIDYPITAAANPPGDSPGTCTNYEYYDTTQSHPGSPHQNGGGIPVEDDGDGLANMDDPGCNAAAPISPVLPREIPPPPPHGPTMKEIVCVRIGHLKSADGSDHGGWFQTNDPPAPIPWEIGGPHIHGSCDTSGPAPIPAPAYPGYIANLPVDDLDSSQFDIGVDKTVSLIGGLYPHCLIGLGGSQPDVAPMVSVGPINEYEPVGYSTQPQSALDQLKFSIGLPAGSDWCEYEIDVEKHAKGGYGPLLPTDPVTARVDGYVCDDRDEDGVFTNCPGESRPRQEQRQLPQRS